MHGQKKDIYWTLGTSHKHIKLNNSAYHLTHHNTTNYYDDFKNNIQTKQNNKNQIIHTHFQLWAIEVWEAVCVDSAHLKGIILTAQRLPLSTLCFSKLPEATNIHI